MFLTNRLSPRWTRRTASAVLVAGTGLASIAGCALNMTPGEKLAASAQEEAESKTPVTRSALSRLLKKQPEQDEAVDTAESTSRSSTTVGRGRLFSALVDRFPFQKKDAADPFLEAEIEAERDRSRIMESDKRVAAAPIPRLGNAVARAPAGQRTDEELWKLLADDAAAAVRTGNDPTLTAQEPPARAFPTATASRDARPGAGSIAAARTPATKARTASTSVETAPVPQAGSTENPFAKFLRDQEPEAPAPEATVAGAARQELQDLLSQAHRDEQGGARQQTRPSAADAAAIAKPDRTKFAREEEDPTEVVGQLEKRLQASMNDPFGGAALNSATPTSPEGTSPFAAGSSIGSALPWSTRVQPAATPVASSRDSAPVAKSPATPFPAAPEWRGVRANSPVSLAVVEQSESALTSSGQPGVRHADIDDAAATVRTPGPGRLLPRKATSRDPVFDPFDQSLAFNSAPVSEGPRLAPPTEPTPILLAPALPPTVSANAASQPLASTADEKIGRSRGFGGWILGGLLLASGLWMFGFRGQRITRWHSADGQK